MIYPKLLSLIRQKKLFVASTSSNRTLDLLVENIDKTFTQLIQEIKWTIGDESIIKFLYLIWEDIQKDPTIIHNAAFLEIIVSRYDILFETAYNEPNEMIKNGLLIFLQSWNRSELEGPDV